MGLAGDKPHHLSAGARTSSQVARQRRQGGVQEGVASPVGERGPTEADGHPQALLGVRFHSCVAPVVSCARPLH